MRSTIPRRTVAVVAVAAVLAAAAGCRGEAGEELPSPARTPLPLAPNGSGDLPTARAVAAAGAVTFARHCSGCHGRSGAGDGPAARALDPPPPDLTDADYMWRQRPTYYYRAVAMGVPGTAMLRWDHVLDPMQRWDVAYFAWSRATRAEDLRRGAAIYNSSCAVCHGYDGAGEAEAPLNAARRATLSRAETAAGVRVAHPDLWRQLPASDQDAVVEHLAALLYEAAGPEP